MTASLDTINNRESEDRFRQMSDAMESQGRSPDLRDERAAQFLLWLLLAADFAYIILHILYKTTTLLNSSYFSLKRDLGYSEFFQYAKFLWIIMLLIYVVKVTGTRGFLSWGAVFLYFLLDDAFQIHEDIGERIAGALDFVPLFNLRLQDIGEAAVYAFAALLLMPVVALAYERGSRLFRGISKDILFLLLILICFGFFVDMAEIAADQGVFVEETLGLVDDGGEMLVTSALFWYVFRLALRKGTIETFILDRLRIRAGQRAPKTG